MYKATDFGIFPLLQSAIIHGGVTVDYDGKIFEITVNEINGKKPKSKPAKMPRRKPRSPGEPVYGFQKPDEMLFAKSQTTTSRW